MNFTLSNIFTNHLSRDPDPSNQRRQVLNSCFSIVHPCPSSKPVLIAYSDEVAAMIGIDENEVQKEEFLEVFAGNKAIEGAIPYAMCYGGHQFGHWAGQLGDGRAINIADIIHNGTFFTLQLKGAGPTPYSRSADGLAVLRSSIREFLCSEAMHFLGVPTTRALSIIATGDNVLRDKMYDGNAAYEPGATVCRVAPSFVRFGNFEIFAARQDIDNLRSLTNFTIQHFFKHLGTPSKTTYLQFLKEVADTTLAMVIHWQRVGFVHGVMNTDNMSILGLTIDYGPYGWLEDFDLSWTPNTTDGQGKRYAYGNQPNIALWNLMKLMNALYPLIEDVEPLQEILNDFNTAFTRDYTAMMASKLGLETVNDEVKQHVQKLIELMQMQEIDYTIFFRNLANILKNDDTVEIPDCIKFSFYDDKAMDTEKWLSWLKEYRRILKAESTTDNQRALRMNAVNPKYVLRNYMAHEAISLAENGDYSLVNDFLTMLKKPYDEQANYNKWFAKRPEWARVKIGCSMLSCSS